MNGKVIGALLGTAVVGTGIAAALIVRGRGEDAAPGTGAPTRDDPSASSAWKDDLASFVYTSKKPEGGLKMFSVEAKVLGGTGFTRVGASFDDAVAAAKLAAVAPLADEIHDMPIQQAHGVLQATDGVYWIAPLGGFHRGAEDGLFIDGAFWDQHGVSIEVQPHTTDLKAVVGATTVIDLRDVVR